jgi:4-amino-4-deoxy-L-arabinose transferase-like glycosyltransferase
MTRFSGTRILQLFVILISIPALFINLGLLPLISDEPTRGIVTLEMLISGDYIHPTINGELYFNKPPLFNWIQAVFISISGSTDEWVFRLPAVVSLIFFCIIIYFSSKKYLGYYAFIAALGYLVCGRILFWDSFMGLIDISYSIVVYTSFMWMIHFHRKEKYLLFFTGSYFLAGIGFLMKGLPSVAFQVLSLVALLVFDHKEKEIFTRKHFVGVMIFVIIIGGYYLIFSLDHPIEKLIHRLFDESNRLQSGNGSSSNWWWHLIEFPFMYLYEFTPLSIFAFLLLNKKIRVHTFEEPYFRYLILLFLVNIMIYWVSADMRSRYLFMLVPLMTIISVKAYAISESYKSSVYRAIRYVIIASSFIVAISLVIYPFWYETKYSRNVLLICAALFSISIIIWVASIINKRLILLSLIASLLIARIAFNLFNLPARNKSYPDQYYKQGEIKAAVISAGHPLYILADTPINHDLSFYVTRERGEILRRTTILSQPEAFYITNEENLNIFAKNSKNYRVHHIFRIKLNETRLFLVTER